MTENVIGNRNERQMDKNNGTERLSEKPHMMKTST